MYPLSHLISRLLIQSFNSISSFIMPNTVQTLGQIQKVKPEASQEERTDMKIQKFNTYNSKPECTGNPEKGVVFQKYTKLHMEMFKPNSLQTKKPQNSGFSIDILTKYQKKKI